MRWLLIAVFAVLAVTDVDGFDARRFFGRQDEAAMPGASIFPKGSHDREQEHPAEPFYQFQQPFFVPPQKHLVEQPQPPPQRHQPHHRPPQESYAQGQSKDFGPPPTLADDSFLPKSELESNVPNQYHDLKQPNHFQRGFFASSRQPPPQQHSPFDRPSKEPFASEQPKYFALPPQELSQGPPPLALSPSLDKEAPVLPKVEVVMSDIIPPEHLVEEIYNPELPSAPQPLPEQTDFPLHLTSSDPQPPASRPWQALERLRQEQHALEQEFEIPVSLPQLTAKEYCQKRMLMDGFHVDGCKQFFYDCTFFKARFLLCPAGLFFDNDKQECNYKDLVSACLGEGSTPKLPQQDENVPFTPQHQPPAPVEDYCLRNNLMDGFHVEGCKPYYFDCTNFETKRVPCPEGTFFDVEFQFCEFKHLIPACGGSRTSFQRPFQKDFCQQNNLIEGHHTDGCKPYYFACSPLNTIRNTCPEGTFYDVEENVCDKKELIAACGGSRPASQHQQPKTNDVDEPAKDFCQRHNLIEGLHGEGCNPYLFVCSPLKTLKYNCPEGLYFDVQEQICMDKQFIPGCQSPQLHDAEAHDPVHIPQEQSQEDTLTSTPAPTTPAPIPEYDCTNKSDGVYVVGCTPKYNICMFGNLTTLTCPHGKFYSVSAEKCEHKIHVPECGGTPPSSTEDLPESTTAEDEPKNACTGLANGIYGRKCNQQFVACLDQKAVNFTCPDGLAFNLKTVKCSPKTEIQTCPEFNISQLPTPQPQKNATTSQPEEASTTLQPFNEERILLPTTHVPLAPSSQPPQQEPHMPDKKPNPKLRPSPKGPKLVTPPPPPQTTPEASPPPFAPQQFTKRQLHPQTYTSQKHFIPDFQAPPLPRQAAVAPPASTQRWAPSLTRPRYQQPLAPPRSYAYPPHPLAQRTPPPPQPPAPPQKIYYPPAPEPQQQQHVYQLQHYAQPKYGPPPHFSYPAPPSVYGSSQAYAQLAKPPASRPQPFSAPQQFQMYDPESHFKQPAPPPQPPPQHSTQSQQAYVQQASQHAYDQLQVHPQHVSPPRHQGVKYSINISLN